MKFRTEVTPAAASFSLSPERPVLLLGSCFVENIGRMMRSSLWDADLNPCGIQYNPFSIARVIRTALSGRCPDTEYFLHDGLWRNWLLPTSFTALTRQEAEALADEAFAALRNALLRASAVVVTFGTAFLYGLADSGRVVGNCHKVPQDRFRTRIASVDEIEALWTDLMADLRRLNPDVKFIFTVSPVRHLRPSVRNNTLSKATLHLAVERLTALPDTEYFPAYELLTDDLRDYRFYADDMVHPSQQAVEYIWDKFCATYLTEPSRQLLEQGARLRKRLDHRRLAPADGSPAQTDFERETDRILREFLAAHPAMKP